MQGLLCMDNHDVHAIFGPRPIHRLPFQNSTRQTNTCESICMYICKKGKEMHGMLCLDDHDLHLIFGLGPLHRLPFQNSTLEISACVSIWMDGCKKKERKCMECCAWITMIYMRFLDLDLFMDLHFKTQLDQLGHVCLYVCMHAKKGKEMHGVYMSVCTCLLACMHACTHKRKERNACMHAYM